jgi:hypothetical protein
MYVVAAVVRETKHDVKVRRNNGGSGDVAFELSDRDGEWLFRRRES